MVGTDFMEQSTPMPEGYIQRFAQLDGKVVLGSDFPSIPYQYSHQLAVLNSWGLSDQWLANTLWHTPRKLIGATSVEQSLSWCRLRVEVQFIDLIGERASARQLDSSAAADVAQPPEGGVLV